MSNNKINPRRIVIEETNEETIATGSHCLTINDVTLDIYADKVWRLIKENDLPLTSCDTKLSLSMGECKEFADYINGYRALTEELEAKITEFIKDK